MISGKFDIRKHEQVNVHESSKDKSKDIIQELFDDGYFVQERDYHTVLKEIDKRGGSISNKFHKQAIRSKLKSLVKNNSSVSKPE